MKIEIVSFGGKVARGSPAKIRPPFGTAAENIEVEDGQTRAVAAPQLVTTLPTAGVKSIYRFGQTGTNPAQHWFAWALDVDVVKGAVAKDTQERTFFTGAGVPRFTVASIATGLGPMPAASYPLGLAAPTNAPVLAPVAGTGAATGDLPGGLTRRSYVYCHVNEFGDIGPPSPVGVIDCLVGQHVTLSELQSVPPNGAPTSSRFIYRAEAGGFLFVAEIASGGDTFVDTLASDQLGEEITSTQYDPPPTDMIGLIGLPNGLMAGHTAQDIYLCEPYRGYAWPEDYRLTVPNRIVALSPVAQGFVALTVAAPAMFYGTDPQSMTQEPTKFLQPCVSKRSVVSNGADTLYASGEGICVIGASPAAVITEHIFDRKGWEQLNPSSIIGAWYDGDYVGSYFDGVARRGFMLNTATGNWTDLPDLAATAFYRDTVSGKLYCCIADAIYEFRGAATTLTPRWESAEARTQELDFRAARVVSAQYPVTFRLWADGFIRDEITVTDSEPFLVSPGLATRWKVGFAGRVPESMALATTVEELKDTQ